MGRAAQSSLLLISVLLTRLLCSLGLQGIPVCLLLAEGQSGLGAKMFNEVWWAAEVGGQFQVFPWKDLAMRWVEGFPANQQTTAVIWRL